MDRTIDVNGEELSVIQIAIRQLRNLALKGNLQAIKELLDLNNAALAYLEEVRPEEHKHLNLVENRLAGGDSVRKYSDLMDVLNNARLKAKRL